MSKLELYNNKKLIGKVINNPQKYNNEIICHFPSGPGNFVKKFEMMTNYLNYIKTIL